VTSTSSTLIRTVQFQPKQSSAVVSNNTDQRSEPVSIINPSADILGHNADKLEINAILITSLADIISPKVSAEEIELAQDNEL